MRPYRLGLTGSIGMGKSTTAGFFADAGVPVWDADAAVHRIYARGGPGAAALAGLAPDAVAGGAVDRDRLREAIVADPGLLARVEAADPSAGRRRPRRLPRGGRRCRLVLLDIPLLYETGGRGRGRRRAGGQRRTRGAAGAGAGAAGDDARGAFERILARQLPDAEKRARADFVIETDRGLEAARADVLALLARIRSELASA